jgi:hypothetical protein
MAEQELMLNIELFTALIAHEKFLIKYHSRGNKSDVELKGNPNPNDRLDVWEVENTPSEDVKTLEVLAKPQLLIKFKKSTAKRMKKSSNIDGLMIPLSESDARGVENVPSEDTKEVSPIPQLLIKFKQKTIAKRLKRSFNEEEYVGKKRKKTLYDKIVQMNNHN